jgi:hypothetical protein
MNSVRRLCKSDDSCGDGDSRSVEAAVDCVKMMMVKMVKIIVVLKHWGEDK